MKKGIILILLVLISPISLAQGLKPGKLFINNVEIPYEKGDFEDLFSDLEKSFEKKSISYVYANGQRIAKVENGELFYFHNDHLGSPIAITNSKGEVIWQGDYKPFGESFNEVSFDDGSKVKYNSKELDKDTDLHYYGARYYNAPAGRFITADTVKGELVDPQSLNLYVYTRNNPMKFIDPKGNAAYLTGEVKEKGLDMSSIVNAVGGVVDVFKKWRAVNIAEQEIEFWKAYSEDINSAKNLLAGIGGEKLAQGDIEGFKEEAEKAGLYSKLQGMFFISEEGEVRLKSPERFKGLGSIAGGPALQRLSDEEIANMATMGVGTISKLTTRLTIRDVLKLKTELGITSKKAAEVAGEIKTQFIHKGTGRVFEKPAGSIVGKTTSTDVTEVGKKFYETPTSFFKAVKGSGK